MAKNNALTYRVVIMMASPSMSAEEIQQMFDEPIELRNANRLAESLQRALECSSDSEVRYNIRTALQHLATAQELHQDTATNRS
jgi:hypothetical protein